jgi:hypothetical protein
VSVYKRLVRVEGVGNGHKAEMEKEPCVKEDRGILEERDEYMLAEDRRCGKYSQRSFLLVTYLSMSS